MNKKQLIYFLKTAELRSIAAAARALNVAQPSISQQIANLEHQLGSQLFIRDFRGVCLTENGERFRRHAESIVRQMEQAKLDIQQSEAEPAGRLAIGMTQPIGNILAVPLLTAIEKLYPNVELDLSAGLSYRLVELLKAGDVDMILTSPDSSDMTGIQQEKIFCEKIFIAIGRATQNNTFRDLLNRPFITFQELAEHEVFVTDQRDSLGYMLRQYEQKTGITLKHRPPYGQLMTTLQYVADGHGLLLAPSSAYFHIKKIGLVDDIEIIEPKLQRDVMLATHADRPKTNLMAAVRAQLLMVVNKVHQQGLWQGVLKN